MSQDKDALLRALAFYARIGAALFPIPSGQKDPIGIISNWKFDHSLDPTQWARWLEEFVCNFGVVAFASRLIIIDIDVKKFGREYAWQVWDELCKSWGLPGAIQPHVQSASGGWHILFSIPADFDPFMSQRGLIKEIIDIRTMGYVVSAGSTFNGVPYILMSDRDPEPAPQALLDFVKRQTQTHKDGTIAKRTGLYIAKDIRDMMVWLRDERGGFDSYEQWIEAGMILRLEYGDDLGRELWNEATWKPPHPKAPTQAEMESHWRSFNTTPMPNNVTIRSLFLRAHKEGWKGGTIRISWDSALEQINRTGQAPAETYVDATGQTIAALAQQVGATLSSGQAPPPGASPIPPPNVDPESITQGQRYAKQVERWQSIVTSFLNISDLPSSPTDRCCIIPDVAEHPLAKQMQICVDRIIASAENKPFKPERFNEILAVLQNVHNETYKQVIRKIRSLDASVYERKINLLATGLWQDVEDELRPVVNWIRDAKGWIDTNLADNASVFLDLVGVTIRWNAWLEIAEVRGGEWLTWTYLDDNIVNSLWYRAHTRGIEFNIRIDALWRSLSALALKNQTDPALNELNRLESLWDGQYRLATWLSAATGAPCDLYHQSVGRMIFGNMVRRIREPGCKCDFVPVFWGPQDTGKSTLVQRISPKPEWFTDGVQLGDHQKELVLMLAGKAVVELAEMATKSGRESEHHKAMISAQVDEGRPAYARAIQRRPRRNIFIGTSNPPPLIDTSGNRRYLPIHVTQTIDHEWFKANREQLIAEACVLHSRGDTFNLPANARNAAEIMREEARLITPVEDALNHWFAETDITRAVRWNYITAFDLAELTKGMKFTIASKTDAMSRLGFRSERMTVDSKQGRAWIRGPASAHSKVIMQEGIRYVVSRTPTGDMIARPVYPSQIAG